MSDPGHQGGVVEPAGRNGVEHGPGALPLREKTAPNLIYFLRGFQMRVIKNSRMRVIGDFRCAS